MRRCRHRRGRRRARAYSRPVGGVRVRVAGRFRSARRGRRPARSRTCAPPAARSHQKKASGHCCFPGICIPCDDWILQGCLVQAMLDAAARPCGARRGGGARRRSESRERTPTRARRAWRMALRLRAPGSYRQPRSRPDVWCRVSLRSFPSAMFDPEDDSQGDQGKSPGDRAEPHLGGSDGTGCTPSASHRGRERCQSRQDHFRRAYGRHLSHPIFRYRTRRSRYSIYGAPMSRCHGPSGAGAPCCRIRASSPRRARKLRVQVQGRSCVSNSILDASVSFCVPTD